MIVTKEFTFEAAHKLDWDLGKCKHLHGHTYRLHISVKGALNENGIIIDFRELKQVVNKHIIEELDHNYLNELIKNPTAENIALWIWNKLEGELDLYEIKLWETKASSVIYRGE